MNIGVLLPVARFRVFAPALHTLRWCEPHANNSERGKQRPLQNFQPTCRKKHRMPADTWTARPAGREPSRVAPGL